MTEQKRTAVCPTCGKTGPDSRERDFDSGMIEADCGDPYHDQLSAHPGGVDVGGSDLPNYVRGACTNCGRERLMPRFDGPEDEERLVGIECEKCCMAWPMNSESGDYANPYHPEDHPIPEMRPEPDERDPRP